MSAQAARQRQLYHSRKAAGLCPKCGEPNDSSLAFCTVCFENKQRWAGLRKDEEPQPKAPRVQPPPQLVLTREEIQARAAEFDRRWQRNPELVMERLAVLISGRYQTYQKEADAQ